MRKRIKGRKIQRQKAQRTALMRTLLVSLIKNKRIETTLPKAKELRPYAEKKVTMAKKGLAGDEIVKLAKMRELKKDLPNQDIIKELFKIAEGFKEREGGYIRILKLMPRKSDVAEMALVEWVDSERFFEEKKGGKKKSESVKSEDKQAVPQGRKQAGGEDAKEKSREKQESRVSAK